MLTLSELITALNLIQVKYLLRCGADPDQTSPKRMNALSAAAMKLLQSSESQKLICLEIISSLLENGAIKCIVSRAHYVY